MTKRVDDAGRAFAGSQLQMQLHATHRLAAFEAAICESLGEEEVDLISPVAAESFREYMDGSFLEALGLRQYREQLREFWPKSGPRWDGLGRVNPSGAILLFEGKSYPEEMVSSCSATAESSLELIRKSLDEAKSWFGGASDADWLKGYYQYANRLAHVYFFRHYLGIDAWLVNVCFIDDETTRATNRTQWDAGLSTAVQALGFSDTPKYVVDIFLESGSYAELVEE